MDVISYQYSITHMYNNNEMLNNSLFIIVLETNADGLGGIMHYHVHYHSPVREMLLYIRIDVMCKSVLFYLNVQSMVLRYACSQGLATAVMALP